MREGEGGAVEEGKGRVLITVKHADGADRLSKTTAAHANESIYLQVADKLFTPWLRTCVFVSFWATAD